MLAFLGLPDLISFAGGFPDPLTFPRERASALLAEFAAAGEASAFQYAPTRGLAGTLDALAGRLESLQGRRPAEDELLITSGGMEALELVGKSFLDRGDLVVVEAPTYLGAIMAFRSFEAEVVAVPLDERRTRRRRARAAAGGGAAPEAPLHDPRPPEPGRRQPLGRAADGARRACAPVRVPDRRGRRLPRARLRGRRAAEPLEPRAGRRSCRPGRRRRRSSPACASAGPPARPRSSAQLVAAKQNTDQCAGALGQRLFEEYVRRGWIDEQLAQSRALYRRKCERMLAALERHMPAGVRWTRPEGGFFSWLTLPEGGDAPDLARRAVERGVGIVPGSLFFPDGRGGDNVRLSFSMVDEALIDDGHRAARVARGGVGRRHARGPPRGEADEVLRLVARHRRHDFDVAEGEVFGFLGPNGAGKTTTIRLLLDLIRPTSGRMELFGLELEPGRCRDPATRRLRARRPAPVRADDRAASSSRYFARLRGMTGLGDAPALAERLEPDLDRPIRALSKGNRQKLGLVQAFMHRPDLLVLDEPTLGPRPARAADVQRARPRGDGGGPDGVPLVAHARRGSARRRPRRGVREGRLELLESVDDAADARVHRASR